MSTLTQLKNSSHTQPYKNPNPKKLPIQSQKVHRTVERRITSKVADHQTGLFTPPPCLRSLPPPLGASNSLELLEQQQGRRLLSRGPWECHTGVPSANPGPR
ncbi:hypothetical protein JTE90_016702 [Oedothorax gibbosus]|uniref:Uncharacterized protein n=1 Tax=Oedothorax gibbosus TaxID=931172 RepID=A0AAV6V3J2_9ARAC|nr:hypothetical protein JTE90_016702 [Oedothorax gibbosus]